VDNIAGGRTGDLPAESTSFVGRRREVARLRRLLARCRLVTVTGVGGVGKTRLAVRVAAQLRAGMPDGVCFVDLSALRDLPHWTGEVADPQPAARAVASALAIREDSVGRPLRRVIDYLARRRMLLVLDSCEPVLLGCARLVQALLTNCPGVRILATSRQLFEVSGEFAFAVDPLPVPDSDTLSVPSHELARCASVALLVARARAVRPGFELGEENRHAVAGICRRLDGIPLAIELVAARLATLDVRQVLDQLADRFDPRDQAGAAGRHGTLRACIDWSFGLCTEPERRLWARLSIFADGFDLDAVEGVCADDELPRRDLLGVVAGLVGKSVLVTERIGDRARYRMLDTIREYGYGKLGSAGAVASLRRRHLDWYEQLVARARDDFISPRQPYWLDRLGREHPNLRAAVEHSLTEPGQAEAALRIAVTMPWAQWVTRGLFGEGRRWLTVGLSGIEPATGLHARALLLVGCLAAWQGDYETAARQVDQGEDLARSVADPGALAFAPYVRGLVEAMRGEQRTALRLLEQALTRLSRLPHPDAELRLRILLALGVNAALGGDRAAAVSWYREIVAFAEVRGGSYYRSTALWALGVEAFRRGSPGEAAAHVAASLQIKQERLPIDRYGTALCLETMAWIAAAADRYERAAVLLGAADAVWDRIGTTITAHGNLIGTHEACRRASQDLLGTDGYATAFRRGRELAYDKAIAYALDR